jgi:hypothetical protein
MLSIGFRSKTYMNINDEGCVMVEKSITMHENNILEKGKSTKTNILKEFNKREFKKMTEIR